jgi:hypothetical protein
MPIAFITLRMVFALAWMPIVCLVNHCIELILFVEVLLLSLYHHSGTMLSDMVPLKKWSMLLILISCVYHLDPVPPSLHAWSYFSRLDFENTVWTLRNSACNRLLCQNKVMQSYVKFMQWFCLADFLLGSCCGP